VITPNRPQRSHNVRAISSETKLLRASFHGLSRSTVIAQLVELDLPFKDLTFGLDSGTALFPLLNHPTPAAAAEKLRRALPKATVEEDVAAVSVVGDGLAGNAAALRDFSAIVEAAQPLALVGGPLRLTAVVRPEQTSELSQKLHAAFVV
jgi:aspartokinase